MWVFEFRGTYCSGLIEERTGFPCHSVVRSQRFRQYRARTFQTLIFVFLASFKNAPQFGMANVLKTVFVGLYLSLSQSSSPPSLPLASYVSASLGRSSLQLGRFRRDRAREAAGPLEMALQARFGTTSALEIPARDRSVPLGWN